MKILQIHKYYSRYRGGGSVAAFFETKALLEKKGQEVIVFSMADEKNELSRQAEYFVSHFDINKARTFWQKAKLVPKVIYNREAADNLRRLIEEEKPDVAHVHNIYHYITPSILPVLKKHRIPIVFKLSDYKVICPNYKLFVGGEPCQRCRGGRYYNAFMRKCLKNSYSFSFVAMLEAYFHRYKKTYDNVDVFLSPSEFMREKCVFFGLPAEKIKILRNVLNFKDFHPTEKSGNYFAYVGRLSAEKGLLDLLRAIKILTDNGKLNGCKLVIAGSGPEEKKLKKTTEEYGLGKQVEFRGFLKKGSAEWREFLSESKFTVLPSIWYDNSPVAVSESMAFEVPVIISDRGGTPEMIENGKSGLVFSAGQAEDLARKIEMLLTDEKLRVTMGVAAGERAREINSEEKYYRNLMKIYQSLVEKNAR